MQHIRNKDEVLIAQLQLSLPLPVTPGCAGAFNQYSCAGKSWGISQPFFDDFPHQTCAYLIRPAGVNMVLQCCAGQCYLDTAATVTQKSHACLHI